MKRILLALIRLALTLVLVFLSTGVIWTVLMLPGNLDRTVAVLPATLGFAGGLVAFTLGCHLVRFYVFGHELTHWLTAKLFLRRTGGLSVGETGGSVMVDRPNLLIVLAPYFVPIYTLIWIVVYRVFLLFCDDPDPAATGVAYAGVGVTYAFHVVRTGHALLREQPDLELYGPLFSLSLILFCNVALLFLALIIAGEQWYQGFGLLMWHWDVEWQLLLQFLARVWALCSDVTGTLRH